VVGVGVAGSTAKSLASACDRFDNYDALPGIPKLADTKKESAPTRPRARKRSQDPAVNLLERAMQLEGERADGEWLHASAVKDLMKRLDPSFSEKALGFRSFSDFLKAQTEQVEVDEDSNIVQVRAVARAA
jgi:hypothetical protein